MERLIAIIGPTAVGKTKVGIDLAQRLGSEIISGDSMLVYRGLDIGTAKPDLAERRGVIHHLIDILEPNAEFSVVDFQTQAGQLITTVNQREKIPVIVGGTGLYVKALLEGYRFSPVIGDDEIRSRLTALAETHGSGFLHAMLTELSPDTAAKLHPNDQRRIIRSLEVHQLSGKTVSRLKAPPSSLVYDALVLGLTTNREKLYDRINRRVDAMIAAGLVEEVSRLLAAGVPTDSLAMQGIGYKEIAAALSGETDLPAAVDQIKQATRRFAKRQLTWFRKMPYIQWIDTDTFATYDEMLVYIYRLVAGKFNLG
ncbi:MAG: tRNA (adenosine(37)-N6)-dimethylallyltransferase MiaA [Negativicutes bacterium]|nr:tRNA (adenosine(37)-N6)-dimethylallyltransferase MiaA [Negativicutes bacterium]